MADKVYVKDGKAYEDDEHKTEIEAASEILENIRDGHNSLLEPKFDPEAKFENELKEDTALDDLISAKGDARWPEKLYTLDDELIPAEFRADTENPSNISIQRKLLVIKVDKDPSDPSKLIYHQYTKQGDALVPADAEGNPLAEDADPAEWNPKDSHTRGMKRHEGNKHWIEINDFVFVGTNEAIETAKEVDEIQNLTSKAEKDGTLTHELQHFSNSLKMHELFGSENPHVSIKDYYRLCYLDEVSATLAAVIKDKDKPEAEQSEITKKILNELSGTFPDLATTDGKKELLQTVMKYWDKNTAKLYAASGKGNDQFRQQLNDYVETNPWGSNIADGSEDYIKAAKGMFDKVDGEIDFSEVVLGEDMPDPVKEHEDILKEGMSVSDGENFLDEMEDKADKLCEERAQYGFNEEFENNHRKEPDKEYTTEPFTFESQRGDPFDSEEAEFYKEFFENICKTNNEKEDKEYDLEYVEKSSRRRYEVDLVRKSGGSIDNITNIKINADKKVIMTATTADGKPTIPDQDRFNDLAELAAQHSGNKIKFGNIRNPEFKARLYLACITHKPPVEMENAPDFNNEEFRKSISPATLMSIEAQKRLDDVKRRLHNDEGKEYAESISQNYGTAVAGLLDQKDDKGNNLFTPKMDKDGNIVSVEARKIDKKDADGNVIKDAEGNPVKIIDPKAQEVLKKFIIERRDKHIKNLSDGKTGYNHDKKDASGKPVNFYRQIKEAKGSR